MGQEIRQKILDKRKWLTDFFDKNKICILETIKQKRDIYEKIDVLNMQSIVENKVYSNPGKNGNDLNRQLAKYVKCSTNSCQRRSSSDSPLRKFVM